jgi:hypothetical protein
VNGWPPDQLDTNPGMTRLRSLSRHQASHFLRTTSRKPIPRFLYKFADAAGIGVEATVVRSTLWLADT